MLLGISKNSRRGTRVRGGGSVITVGRGRKSRVEGGILGRFYVCQVDVFIASGGAIPCLFSLDW